MAWGEYISIDTRKFIESSGVKILISTYGASDLDFFLATQNKFVIELEEAMNNDPKLLKAICGKVLVEKIPSVFYFNPWLYLIENTRSGELLYTCLHNKRSSPRIRYNLGDIGKVMKIKDIIIILSKTGHISLVDEAKLQNFPLVFLFC